jgi:hypothetical protein
MQVHDIGDGVIQCVCGTRGVLDPPSGEEFQLIQRLVQASGEEFPSQFVCPACGCMFDAYTLLVVGHVIHTSE